MLLRDEFQRFAFIQAPPPQITRITTEPVCQFLISEDVEQTVSDDVHIEQIGVMPTLPTLVCGTVDSYASCHSRGGRH